MNDSGLIITKTLQMRIEQSLHWYAKTFTRVTLLATSLCFQRYHGREAKILSKTFESNWPNEITKKSVVRNMHFDVIGRNINSCKNEFLLGIVIGERNIK